MRRSRLMPWYIGMVIVILAVLYIGYRMFLLGCPAPGLIELGVLVVIPAIYLGLMYLTLVSQK